MAVRASSTQEFSAGASQHLQPCFLKTHSEMEPVGFLAMNQEKCLDLMNVSCCVVDPQIHTF
jgi:hypothetical protein